MAKYEQMSYVLYTLYSSTNHTTIHANMERISKSFLEGLVCYINFLSKPLKL